MDKLVDQQNPKAGTWVDLQEREKRVRVEVALSWPELYRLGVCELDDLRRFSFSRLKGDYFGFRLPTFRDSSGPPSVRTLATREFEGRRRRIFGEAGVLGLDAYDAGLAAWSTPHRAALSDEMKRQGRPLERQRVGTGVFGTTIAWEELNKRVETALRHLQERERAAMERASRPSGERPRPA